MPLAGAGSKSVSHQLETELDDARSQAREVYGLTGGASLENRCATPKGGPVFNFRSEGRRFADSKRRLVPGSAFFEFTGRKYPKAKHRFTLNGAPFLAVAGVWREASGNKLPTFTMLTTEPWPDVEPYHNRQVVVLRPEDWSAWLDLSKPESELLRPLPAGSLSVKTLQPERT